MAHCLCINGYDMWNGDGKPEINAFSISFLKNLWRRIQEYSSWGRTTRE
ncbi:hypothetical protein [Allobaculum sp. Allo2]|nr:hypothetical protein [Allobaculum sp. Allo2]UNT93955.1 hypothetical protein KWG61_04560 [Allobaculum sp. Allo2]